MKLLCHCQHLIDAHHRVNVLHAAGVRAEVRNTFLCGALGEIPYLEAGPQIWIGADENEAQAQAVLAAAQRRPVLPAWYCAGCGETIEGQFAQCWQCGSVRASEPR